MNVLVERAALDDIANALREIYANDTQYKPSEMADAIRGAALLDLNVESLEATIKPGYYLPRVGLAGYDRVIVEVDEDEFDPDAFQLLSRTFTLNGSYKAEDFGYYGFDTVTVAVNTAVVGLDDDGDDAEAYVDNSDPGSGGGSGHSTGTIKTRKLPNRIVITTLPTKTSYIVAEPISTSGMVVKAYYPDGSLYGDVTSQCSIAPIVASGASIGIKNVSSAGEHLCSFEASGWGLRNYRKYRDGDAYFALIHHDDGRQGGDWYTPLLFATSYDAAIQQYQEYWEGINTWYGESSPPGNAYGLYYTPGAAQHGPDLISSDVPLQGRYSTLAEGVATIAQMIVNGQVSNEVTVSWNRPGDGLVLTDAFSIIVSNPPNPIESGGGSSSSSGNDHPITPHI